MALSSSNRIAFVGSCDAIHGDQIDVLEDDHGRLQRGGQIDGRARRCQALCPVSITTVRPGICGARYIAVSVLPVPGGP